MAGDHDPRFDRLRRRILFFAGLIGFFVYFAVSQATGSFRIEWMLGFLTLMGVSIAQGLDKQ